MKKRVLHIMNYAAIYRGNFIESLERLDSIGKTENFYLFTNEARESGAMSWIEPMSSNGKKVWFLSEKAHADASLIRKIIKENDIAAVHTHFITRKQFENVWLGTRFTGVPVIMHFHNHSVYTRNPVKKWLRRMLYRKCIMIACSESVFESVKKDYPRNEKYYVNNGVNFDRLEECKELSNSDFGVQEDEKPLLVFGFDYYRKGVDLAVKAVEDLRKEGKKYALLISLSRNFEVVEKNICEALGEVPDWVRIVKARNDVASLYNYVDLFLSPSREEGLPYSVVEAAYAKCNVVMSDISAQKNLKVPYGVWCKAEDSKSLAEAIEQAESVREEKRMHITEVQEEMRKNYSVDTWAQNIEELYDRII